MAAGISQAELYELLADEDAAPRVFGAVYEHRLACARYLRDELWKLIDDPTMNRRRMRREIAVLTKRIEEHGPPRE
jgi:hypothetical protein